MANTSNLQFGRQMAPAQFKAHMGVTTLNIVKNPNTGKLFFSSPEDSTVSGAVSANWKADPVFSEVTSPDSGDTFWMLHKKGSENQNVVDTL